MLRSLMTRARNLENHIKELWRLAVLKHRVNFDLTWKYYTYTLLVANEDGFLTEIQTKMTFPMT